MRNTIAAGSDVTVDATVGYALSGYTLSVTGTTWPTGAIRFCKL
jgi:hypothetical protein